MRIIFLFLFLFLITPTTWSFSTTTEVPPPFDKLKQEFDSLEKNKVDLGEKLFFDPILSKNQIISCSSCHSLKFGSSNGQERALGVNGFQSEYNVPVIFNRMMTKIQFWDGRAPSLKEQVLHPIFNPNEMGLTESEMLDRLSASPKYKSLFNKRVTASEAAESLASYVSSLVSGNSRYDQYIKGNQQILTAEEMQGKNLFFNVYRCNNCHSGDNFTNESLSQRCGSQPPAAQDNRYQQKYKVPTLRNLKSSFPYMHHGRLKTLEDVLEFYDQPIEGSSTKGINSDDRRKIILFLNTLNSEISSYRKK